MPTEAPANPSEPERLPEPESLPDSEMLVEMHRRSIEQSNKPRIAQLIKFRFKELTDNPNEMDLW